MTKRRLVLAGVGVLAGLGAMAWVTFKQCSSDAPTGPSLPRTGKASPALGEGQADDAQQVPPPPKEDDADLKAFPNGKHADEARRFAGVAASPLQEGADGERIAMCHWGGMPPILSVKCGWRKLNKPNLLVVFVPDGCDYRPKSPNDLLYQPKGFLTISAGRNHLDNTVAKTSILVPTNGRPITWCQFDELEKWSADGVLELEMPSQHFCGKGELRIALLDDRKGIVAKTERVDLGWGPAPARVGGRPAVTSKDATLRAASLLKVADCVAALQRLGMNSNREAFDLLVNLTAALTTADVTGGECSRVMTYGVASVNDDHVRKLSAVLKPEADNSGATKPDAGRRDRKDDRGRRPPSATKVDAPSKDQAVRLLVCAAFQAIASGMDADATAAVLDETIRAFSQMLQEPLFADSNREKLFNCVSRYVLFSAGGSVRPDIRESGATFKDAGEQDAALERMAAVLGTDVRSLRMIPVIFDNQSGQPAVVRLIGPTRTGAALAAGKKEAARATPGRYCAMMRYGTPGNFRYARGQEFEVTEDADPKALMTITLLAVAAGNLGVEAISGKDFDAETSLPPLSGPHRE